MKVAIVCKHRDEFDRWLEENGYAPETVYIWVDSERQLMGRRFLEAYFLESSEQMKDIDIIKEQMKLNSIKIVFATSVGRRTGRKSGGSVGSLLLHTSNLK